ncbi:endo-1,4-D-glucanase [Xanthomonas arboricola]|uniref:cellulose synthase complex periplasmic endoglucanase BcsZ n=1 Tax=Xanthomonas arboricola TaxID=56448 RepID=UPI000CEEC449|nr:cellulose synthase complex periplasmic endoglucanase BcsZ [Xanthomonas arboricola]PPU45174.1 endo-1,4-D-glucanase [Xanthomonas arboricola]
MSAHDSAATMTRRRLLRAGALAGLAALLPTRAAAVAGQCGPWSLWNAFVDKHIQPDGRVVDFLNPDQRSTSEGQSYALFFALVNNDQVLFEKVLGWTRHNLCGGRPDLNLPAWLWGRDGSGSWRVLDANTASDGELWIAYALLEAGRLWSRPGYLKAGQQILQLMRQQEVAMLPGLGAMLLPGRTGFAEKQRWTLNPSYLPIQVLRRCANADPKGPWAAIASNAARVLRESAPVGFAPDWTVWDGERFGPDPKRGNVGSYDAIRVYLWTGMLDAGEPLRSGLLRDLSGPADLLAAQTPFAEKIDTARGVGSGAVPVGFSAALLPYLSAMGQPALLKAQAQRIPAAAQAAAAALPYFERTLALFGQGWLENRYRFAADGRLLPAWRTPACSAKN